MKKSPNISIHTSLLFNSDRFSCFRGKFDYMSIKLCPFPFCFIYIIIFIHEVLTLLWNIRYKQRLNYLHWLLQSSVFDSDRFFLNIYKPDNCQKWVNWDPVLIQIPFVNVFFFLFDDVKIKKMQYLKV